MEIQMAHLSEERFEKHKRGLSIAMQLREQGGDIDTLLAYLRHHDYHPLDCIKIMRELESITLGDAKILVLQSPVWRDKAVEHETIVDSLLSELDDTSSPSGKRTKSQHIFSVFFAYKRRLYPSYSGEIAWT